MRVPVTGEEPYFQNGIVPAFFSWQREVRVIVTFTVFWDGGLRGCWPLLMWRSFARGSFWGFTGLGSGQCVRNTRIQIRGIMSGSPKFPCVKESFSVRRVRGAVMSPSVKRNI